MDLLEKIDELQANSVTPKEFEDTWGMSLEQYKQELADYVEKVYMDRQVEAEVDNHAKEERRQPAAALPAAAAGAAPSAKTKERSWKRKGVKRNVPIESGFVVELDDELYRKLCRRCLKLTRGLRGNKKRVVKVKKEGKRQFVVAKGMHILKGMVLKRLKRKGGQVG